MSRISYRECVSSFCLPFSAPWQWQSTAIRTNATAMKGEMDNTVGMSDCIHPKWLSTISTMLTREQFLLEEIASFMPVDSMPICHQPFLCITSMEILILSSNSNVFSHCTRLGDRYNCTNVCESIWFKIWANLDDEKLSDCAKEFKGQYGDVTQFYGALIRLESTPVLPTVQPYRI